MSAEAITALVKKVPDTIEAVEGARMLVLEDQDHYNAYSQAFYDSLDEGSEGSGEQAREAIGRFVMGQQERALAALAGLDGEVPTWLRARIQLEGGRWQSALNELAALGPKAAELLAVRLARLECLCLLGRTEEAETELAALEGQAPDSPDCIYARGMVQEASGEYEESARLYGQALAVDAQHRGALFRLAYHESLRGENDVAIEIYERLCALKPLPIGALLNLGLLFEDEQDYGLAAQCFQRVLDFDPTHARARMFLDDARASQTMLYDEERERKEDKRAQVLRIPVTDFELSVRSRNCLANMNVRTLGDLIKLSEAELLAFKNFGETSLHEIKQILSQKGLRLGMAPQEAEAPPPPGPVDPDSVLARGVVELDLSVRSRKALETLGVRTLGELSKIAEARLLACKNFGQTSLLEIKKKLGDLGLTLAAS